MGAVTMAIENQPVSISLEDIQTQPEMLVRLFSERDQASFHVRKNGDQITIFSGKAYPESVRDVVKRAKARHEEKKKSGLSREEAFASFEKIQDEIQHHLK